MQIKTLNLGFVNAYLLHSEEGYCLIDSGLPMQWELLLSELEGAKPKLVILTHGDWDHTGNVERLQKKFHCKIAIHKADYEWVAKGVLPKRRVAPLIFKLFFYFRRLFRAKPMPATWKPDIYLKEGQSLFGLKVFCVPGHTKGSVALLSSDGDLFAGDTFVNQRHPRSAMIIENQKELSASISRLKSLHVRTVFPGHGKPFLMSVLNT